jgi:hypothetical protein
MPRMLCYIPFAFNGIKVMTLRVLVLFLLQSHLQKKAEECRKKELDFVIYWTRVMWTQSTYTLLAWTHLTIVSLQLPTGEQHNPVQPVGRLYPTPTKPKWRI